MALPRRVAIVGAALSDCGRVDDKDVFELHYQGPPGPWPTPV